MVFSIPKPYLLFSAFGTLGGGVILLKYLITSYALLPSILVINIFQGIYEWT